MKAPRAKLRLSAAEELEHVVVVNRHTYSGPQDNSYIYIGRGTPLGNQWSHVTGTAATHKVDTREKAVTKFNDWLSDQIDKGEGPVFKFIQQIKERAAIGEQIKLVCSCVPELCHGDVVKAAIELLIHNDRHQQQPLQRESLQITQAAQEKSDRDPNPAARTSPAPTLSGRAEQAHSEVLAIDSISDDLQTLYSLQEGLTRAEHASQLNSIDQFAREAFERGATLTEGVLSIPKDPDARPRDDDKVTIGTEAHAINFVRGFIADPDVAAEKGHLLFELGNKACGQWTDSDGRLTIFNHIYSEIRQDESGNYRSNEEKAEVIDKVLEETALWAQPLPEPVPEPTAEEAHQYTLALAEENRTALTMDQPPAANLSAREFEPELPVNYIDHLNSSSYGLATIGEISGFEFDNTLDSNLIDESQIYADMYEMAISDPIQFATPEGDHLGAERETGTSVTLDATFDRINLSALPPQIPDSLGHESQTELFEHLLPSVDAQLENGLSKHEILSPIYDTNRELAQQAFENQVSETFTRAGQHSLSENPITRIEDLNAISSLRILVRAEYVQQTKGFSREAIQWAKENYRQNPDWLRSQGNLPKGEYQRIVTAQSDARTEWLNAHPGQQAPTRAEIASINRLEHAGNQLNAAIAGINPTPQEHAQALDLIQSRLASTSLTAETLLQGYEAAEQTAHQLSIEAIQFADNVRASSEFQELKATLHSDLREGSIDAREALIRGNNPRFESRAESNYAQPFDHLPPGFDWQGWEDQQIAQHEQRSLSPERSLEPAERTLPTDLDPLDLAIETDREIAAFQYQQALESPATDQPFDHLPPGFDWQGWEDQQIAQHEQRSLSPERSEPVERTLPTDLDPLDLAIEADREIALFEYQQSLESPTPDQPYDHLPPGFDWQAWEDRQIAEHEQQLSREPSHEPPTPSSPTGAAVDKNNDRSISNYPELTGDARPLTRYAQISVDNEGARRDTIQTLTEMLVSPDIEAAQALNNAQLASYNEICNHLTGQSVTNAAQAREALSAKLQGLEKASTMVDGTRARFGLDSEPKILTDLSPAPAYVSLASSPNVRVPVADSREYDALLSTAQQCRIETNTWSSLTNPRPISGVDQERADLTRFVSNYIDFRLKDHTTRELSYNPTFRNYTERLSAARSPEELIKTSADIKLENYELHQQAVAHQANPASIPGPDRQPLTVMEMREVFLSTSPSAAVTRADRADMRDILRSMAIFGKEKEERVELLVQGKIEPSPTLAKLLTNLETRQTVRAVNHFYSSLRTPQAELLTKNRFDLHQAHARLPQYEKDYLHNHALAQKYEAVNNKQQGPQLTPDQTAKAAAPSLDSPAKTAAYREYYGRADWLEAQNVVTAAANLERGASANLDRSTIVSELKDVEVQAINYVVNTFDQSRQEQIAEFLKSSPDEHQQAIGDMIQVASDIKLAGAGPDVKEIELHLPDAYTLSPDSVTAVVNYTQQESERAVTATHLPPSELSELRQEAQAQAWRDMERDVVKDLANILDAPAETLYQAQNLAKDITQTAELQEKARTAFQTVNAHTNTCINKVEQAINRESSTPQFRSPQQQETTRELVKAALNPELQQSKADLIKGHSPEYALIERTLTPNDREQAAQLKDYAANTRGEYLKAFTTLDRDQQALKAQEQRPTIEPRSATQTTIDRYTEARDEITRATLGENVQAMVQDKSLPEIPRDQLATLTVKDLIPEEVRAIAVEQAREPAWQSLEPKELRDVAAGREVPERLVTIADEVMDRVASAQTIELQVDEQREQLSNFIAEQVAIFEAPIKEERATAAYDEQFRNSLTTIASSTVETPERVEAANQILATLDRAELDPATLVSQATAQQLDLVPSTVTLEANQAAVAVAQEIREQPLSTSAEAREAVQQQVIAELKGNAADRYTQLQTNIETVQEKFQSSLHAVDEKVAQLDLARADLTREATLQEFTEISRPAAVQINDYLRDTIDREGLPAILDSQRFEEHVQQVANVIVETARNNGITLGATRESAQEVNQVASSLFNTLSSGMERANSEHALTHQITHTYDTVTHLNDQTFNQLIVAAPTGSNDHAAHASFDQRDDQRRREETDRQKQGAPTTKLPDQSGREPSAQDVAKTQDIAVKNPGGSTLTDLGGNAAELGGSIEDLAAVLAL